MQATQTLLEQALEQMETLADAAQAAQAIAAEYAKQKALLHDKLADLKQAVILLAAPAGMGLVSGSHLQVSAGQNLIATAGGSVDIGVVKRFTVAAGDAISLFAAKFGMKLFAAKGMVDIQAQSDAMNLAALQDLSIISTDGKLILSAGKEVWIGAGGSYIRITPQGIENGTPGDILEKCAAWDKQGANSMRIKPSFPPPKDLRPGQKGFFSFSQ